MKLDIEGKTALVTGGSVGIGLVVARALFAEDVHVAICARDKERVTATASEIAAGYGVRTLGIDADNSKQAGIDRVTRSLTSEMGGIDFLVNNAGTGSEGKIVSAPDEKWHYCWDLQVMAAVRLARAFVPSWRRVEAVSNN